MEKTIENVTKHTDIKLVTTERRKNNLVNQFLQKICWQWKFKKNQIIIYKPVFLGLSILELSKILKYEFWYDYVKTKYGEKAKLSDMGTCFTLYTETDDIYKDIAEHVETWFDISNYELDRPLPKGKNKKSSWIDEKWVGWRTHKKICWIESKNL